MTPDISGWNEQDLAEASAVELLQFLGCTCVLPKRGTVVPHGVLPRTAARGTFAQSE